MNLEQMSASLAGVLTRAYMLNALVAILILLVGAFIARRSQAAVDRVPQLDVQQRLLLQKIAYYGLMTFAVAAALGQLGVDIRVLLGAAGVLTVAVGFAAQTSASNLISGIFLMVEKPFTVGDIIAVGAPTDHKGVFGEVMSIDLLSSKIKTFNNLMVRVPNETLVKTNIINYSYFKVRRLDFNVNVAYGSDLRKVERLLRDAAGFHPLCLQDPQPIFILQGFGDSAVNLQFQVWTLAENMLRVQNDLYREIKTALDSAGIEIPYPTRMMIPMSSHGSAQSPTVGQTPR